MINEFNGEDLDLWDVFEGRNVDMISFGNVEEDSINKEEERFNVKELAPWKTQIEEELGESLVVNSLFIHLFSLPMLSNCFLLSPRL